MSELPRSWETTTLGELASVGTGATPKKSESRYYVGGTIPWVTSGAVNFEYIREAEAYITDVALKETNCRTYPPGTLLVAMYGEGKTRGKVAELQIAAATNQALAAVQISSPDIDRNYIRLLLTSKYLAIRSDAAGGVQPNLNLDLVRNIHVPLAPTSEQRRIVAKLDSLRARSTRARHELDHIPKLFERYKQAILAKAFSGEMTADWRAAHLDVSWSHADVQHIQERHDAYLAARRGSRLRELAVSEQADELPATWLHGNLADAVDLLAGFAFKSAWYQKTGVRLLRGANIAPSALDWSDEVRLSEEQAADYGDYRLIAGDVVVAMDRPMIAGGFKIARVPKADEGALLVQRVSRIRPFRQLDPAYAWHFLNSQIFIDHAMSTATGSDLPHISANDILSAPIHLPPLSEQQEIARRLASAFAWLDKIATEHARAEHLLPKLDQAILAKAFRGELVPQDPNDEPASVLLDRIKSEREGAERPPGRRVRG